MVDTKFGPYFMEGLREGFADIYKTNEESNMPNPPYIMDGPSCNPIEIEERGDVVVMRQSLGKFRFGNCYMEDSCLYTDEYSIPYSNHTIFEYRDIPRDISDASNNSRFRINFVYTRNN
jgi:hypothetical protein